MAAVTAHHRTLDYREVTDALENHRGVNGARFASNVRSGLLRLKPHMCNKSCFCNHLAHEKALDLPRYNPHMMRASASRHLLP